MNYHDELKRAMTYLGWLPNAIILGQGVGNPGTTMSSTFADVPKQKLLEMPVAEDMQAGMAIGMALTGFLPVCVFPRWNFLICAANQLVNHLDRLPLYGNGFNPKVIVRTAVPSNQPFDPGPQHDADFTDAFRAMFRTIQIISLKRPEHIVPAYEYAVKADHSTLLVEFTEFYREERVKEMEVIDAVAS